MDIHDLPHPERRTAPTQASLDKELERFQSQCRSGLLAAQPAEAFQRVTRSAATLLDVPIALISLSDGERPHFIARHGIDSTTEVIELCGHIVFMPEQLHVPDSWRAAAPAERPHLAHDLKLPSLLCEPLRGESGEALGALCVMDRRVRSFSPAQRRILQRYARAVEQLLRL